MKLKTLAALAVAASLPAQAIAQDCFSGPFGAYGTPAPAFLLVTAEPVFKDATYLTAPVPAAKGLILAEQKGETAPVLRYLDRDVTLLDDKGQSLANAVPLAAGSPISVWRDATGERHCSVGWKGGLFGGAMGEGHYRWICFEDRDGDGRYENAWRPKTGNMGFSFKRFDMPVTPPVGWTNETRAAAATPGKNVGAIGAQKLSRRIEVTSVSKKAVRVWYWGAGAGVDKANRIDLPADRASSVILGGVTISLAPNGKAPPTLAV